MVHVTSPSLSEIHQTIVHWPFALAGVALAADGLSYGTWTPLRYFRASWILSWILVVTIVAADATGVFSLGLVTLPPGLVIPTFEAAGYALLATAASVVSVYFRRGRGVLPTFGRHLVSSLSLGMSFIILGWVNHLSYSLTTRYGMGTDPGVRPATTIGIPAWVLVLMAGAVGAGALGVIRWVRYPQPTRGS